MGKQNNFKFFTAKVISISEHRNAPFTIEVETKSFLCKKKGAVTVDPRCTFYKYDKTPKTIDIIEQGDNIKITYIIHKNIKVAFNIIVMPK